MDSGSAACRCDGPRWARPRRGVIETQGVARWLAPPRFALGWYVLPPWGEEARVGHEVAPGSAFPQSASAGMLILNQGWAISKEPMPFGRLAMECGLLVRLRECGTDRFVVGGCSAGVAL